MESIKQAIELSQKLFRDRLVLIRERGGLSEDCYVRLLSVEYHLTRDVQRHFLAVAAHPSLANRKDMRTFLFNFALEEELHYLIALKDMKSMKREPYGCNLDVKLWKSYFDSVITERPFLRLGGTCILENITAGSRDVLGPLLKEASFLNPRNTRFIVLHQHSADTPHGDQILDAIEHAKLDSDQLDDIVEGARIATIMFLRMIDWCITGNELTTVK